MDPSCTVHYVDDCVCFASREDLSLSLWRGPATIERVQAQRRVLERLVRSYGKVGALSGFRIASVSMGPFNNPELRAEFDGIAKWIDGKLWGHALVVEGTGFLAATVRGAALSMSFLMRNKVPAKIFEDAQTAADWLATARPPAPKLGEQPALASLLREMNARLDAAAASAGGPAAAR